MQGFLRLRAPYTILPTPLPDDLTSELNELYFTDSPTQDQLAVIDACLHNLYDVPRAKAILNRLREENKSEAVLSANVYNSFLGAYFAMAEKEPSIAAKWVEDGIVLYENMESGKERIAPNASTYAQLLLAAQCFGPDSSSPLFLTVDVPAPAQLLRAILDRNISVSLVVSDKAFSTSEEAARAIRDLSKAAVELNLSRIVNELGMADVLGRQTDDVLENVPEAIPVLKLKVRSPRSPERPGSHG